MYYSLNSSVDFFKSQNPNLSLKWLKFAKFKILDSQRTWNSKLENLKIETLVHPPWIYICHFIPNRPSGDPHYFGFFFHVISWRASPKNTVYEVLNFLKNFMGSLSPKITQKTKNDTVRRSRFGWNLDSKLYVRKRILRAIGKSGRGFGSEFMRNSKLNLKKNWIKKRQLLNMRVPTFLYTNSMLLFVTRTTRIQLPWAVKKYES